MIKLSSNDICGFPLALIIIIIVIIIVIIVIVVVIAVIVIKTGNEIFKLPIHQSNSFVYWDQFTRKYFKICDTHWPG